MAATLATSQQTVELPFAGQWYHSPAKKFSTTIVFVHNFGGSKTSLVRHIRFVTKLGFDCVAFNLSHNTFPPPLVRTSLSLPLSKNRSFGIRYIWQDQLTEILDLIAGDKIIYSLSMPSAAALAAIAERQTKDINAWVCDGGPFFEEFTCMWNLLSHAYNVKNIAKKLLLMGVLGGMLGNLHRYHKEMHQYLESLPSDFPILSVRGWKDQLVPVSAIDKVFTNHRHFDLEVLALPEGGHLDGLGKHAGEYKPRVQDFLKRASKIN